MNDPSRLLADQVLAYLVQHPQTQDTMEGFVEWWLLKQAIPYDTRELEAALSDLVEHDYLVAWRGHDGRTCYGLNRTKEGEIRIKLENAPTAHKSDPASPA